MNKKFSNRGVKSADAYKRCPLWYKVHIKSTSEKTSSVGRPMFRINTGKIFVNAFLVEIHMFFSVLFFLLYYLKIKIPSFKYFRFRP